MAHAASTLPLPAQPIPAAERAAEAQATLRERTDRAALEERARALLGCSPDEQQAAYAPCAVPLSAEHTHYVDGMALYLRAPGAAVALCPARALEVIAENPIEKRALRAVAAESGGRWQVAGVAARPMDELAAAASLASALATLLPDPQPPARLAEILSDALERPVSTALLAASALPPGDHHYVLADARSARARAFPVPEPLQSGEEIAWALLDVGVSASPSPETHRARLEAAERVATRLRAGGMGEGMASLRDLEHRLLHEALYTVPEAERPLTRYLVGEDRRAQRMLAALRRGRVPMLGATLLIGHDALASYAGERTDEADWVVEQGRGEDGLFGARAIGGGRHVLLLGRPYALPPYLDRIKDEFRDAFGRKLRVRIL
jgi:galactokinase